MKTKRFESEKGDVIRSLFNLKAALEAREKLASYSILIESLDWTLFFTNKSHQIFLSYIVTIRSSKKSPSSNTLTLFYMLDYRFLNVFITSNQILIKIGFIIFNTLIQYQVY